MTTQTQEYRMTEQGEQTSTIYYADSVEAAARLYVADRYPRGTMAMRISGDRGKSGFFQPYRREADGSLNSTGSAFHAV